MPTLLLVNGPPGSGKSTLADALASQSTGMTAIDLDAIKHGLDVWPADPNGAGLRARELALRRIEEELGAGHDVVLGQYLARPEFIHQLEALADEKHARFVVVFLHVDEPALAQRLARRAAQPDRPEHRVNNALVAPEDAGQLVESLRAVRSQRRDAHDIDAGASIQETVAALRRILHRIKGTS